MSVYIYIERECVTYIIQSQDLGFQTQLGCKCVLQEQPGWQGLLGFKGVPKQDDTPVKVSPLAGCACMWVEVWLEHVQGAHGDEKGALKD